MNIRTSFFAFAILCIACQAGHLNALPIQPPTESMPLETGVTSFPMQRDHQARIYDDWDTIPLQDEQQVVHPQTHQPSAYTETVSGQSVEDEFFWDSDTGSRPVSTDSSSDDEHHHQRNAFASMFLGPSDEDKLAHEIGVQKRTIKSYEGLIAAQKFKRDSEIRRLMSEENAAEQAITHLNEENARLEAHLESILNDSQEKYNQVMIETLIRKNEILIQDNEQVIIDCRKYRVSVDQDFQDRVERLLSMINESTNEVSMKLQRLVELRGFSE